MSVVGLGLFSLEREDAQNGCAVRKIADLVTKLKLKPNLFV